MKALLLEFHNDFSALSENQSRQKQKSSLFDEKMALELLLIVAARPVDSKVHATGTDPGRQEDNLST
jgi:hypothetical protein